MRRVAVYVLGLSALAVAPGHAQRIPAPLIRTSVGPAQAAPSPLQTERSPRARGSVIRALGFGLLLGGAGFVAGALVGDAASRECDNADDICIPQAAFYGAAGGGTLGMATGVHLGNRREGKFLLDLLAATAVWSTGIAVAAGSDDETLQAAVLIAIPVVQLGTTVLVERSTGAH